MILERRKNPGVRRFWILLGVWLVAALPWSGAEARMRLAVVDFQDNASGAGVTASIVADFHLSTPSGRPRARAFAIPFDGEPGLFNAMTDANGASNPNYKAVETLVTPWVN